MVGRSTRKKRVTLHDVADAAGVSIATVSYVLNGQGSVSEEVRREVKRAAKKLGYRQNRAARAMKMGRSNILGLVIPNIENPFFATLAQAVLKESQTREYQVFLVDTEGSHKSEKKAMQGLIAQGVDGIIVFPIDDSQLRISGNTEVPVVVLDRDTPDLDLVQAEYYEGGRLLAAHLQDLGHRRIGLLEGPRVVTSARDRTRGLIENLGAEQSIVWREEHPFALELSDAARKMLDRDDVTAVVCGNDLIAIAAISYLQSQGRSVPGDLSVTGFDDISFAPMVSPPLTTVRMPIAGMGKEAVNLLIRRVQSDEPEATRSRLVLDVDLIVRGSTGKAR